MRTKLLLLWIALPLTPFQAGIAAETAPSLRPNVLVLFADDQRADTIGALGNPLIQTPNIDRIVKRGVSFNRAHMQGSLLGGATCIPSRAMLLSGQSLFRIDERLLTSDTWPEAFARSGYKTFVSGKWHNGNASLIRMFQTARSMFLGGMADPMHAKLSTVQDGKLLPATASPKHACEVFADETIRFLKEHQSGPFFAYVPFDAPHDPHVVPDDFPIRYDASKIPLPPNFLPQHPFDHGDMVVRDEKLLPWPRTEDAIKSMLADYYRYISYLDAQVGKILDALEASPHAKNTIVVYAADSGVARGSHGLIGKQNLYEFDSVLVPLIVSGPGIVQDKRTNAQCYLFDVLPTLGKRCGVEAPKESQGIDLGDVLQDPDKAGRSTMVYAYQKFQRAVSDGRWKLIRYPEIGKVQLFDLQQDPHETHDLSDEPSQAPKVNALTALLKQELKSAGDTLDLEVPHPKQAAWTPPVQTPDSAEKKPRR